MEEKQARAKLFEKWRQVMESVTVLPKNGYNDHFQYSFVRDEDVQAAVHEAMVNNGLVFFPSITDVQHVWLEGPKQKVHAKCFMSMTIGDCETGETMVIPWFGEAIDSQDKGTSKAGTLGIKYFWLKSLIISTGDEPDPDAGPTPKRQPSQQVRNDGNPADFVISFGSKFPGQTVAAIYAADEGISYLQWMASPAFEARNDKAKRAKIAAAAYLALQEAPPENPPKAQDGDSPHWGNDEKTRKRYFAWLNEHDWTPADAKKALGVESMKDYDGSVGDAFTALTEARA